MGMVKQEHFCNNKKNGNKQYVFADLMTKVSSIGFSKCFCPEGVNADLM